MTTLARWFDRLITTISQRIADRITAPTPSADTPTASRPRIRLWDSQWTLIADSGRGDTISL